MSASSVQNVRLGDLIELVLVQNSDGAYGIDDVCGMTITKEIIPTKANLTGNDLSKFLVVSPKQFIYNPRTHGKRIGLGYNNSDRTILISWNNTAFKVKDVSVLSPDYLFIYFNRLEWDRNACWCSWGSSTEVFSWGDFCRMKIPLPSLEEQERVVAPWKALRALKEQNEAMAEPLFALCRSRLQEMKKEYETVELGPMLKRLDNRNFDNTVKEVKGLSVTKQFREPTAKVDKENLSSYKIVYPGQFGFVQTTNNEKCFVCCLSNYTYPIVISSVNEVFDIKNKEKLIPEFLYLYFLRKEFDRYARYHSWGSAREIFNWDALCRVRIPLPPLSVQKALVDVYRCAAEAKRMAEEADRLSRDICPALIQHAARGGN